MMAPWTGPRRPQHPLAPRRRPPPPARPPSLPRHQACRGAAGAPPKSRCCLESSWRHTTKILTCCTGAAPEACRLGRRLGLGGGRQQGWHAAPSAPQTPCNALPWWAHPRLPCCRYRPQSGFRKSLASLFRLHNETGAARPLVPAHGEGVGRRQRPATARSPAPLRLHCLTHCVLLCRKCVDPPAGLLHFRLPHRRHHPPAARAAGEAWPRPPPAPVPTACLLLPWHAPARAGRPPQHPPLSPCSAWAPRRWRAWSISCTPTARATF